jgi:hypothetical protein
MESLKEYRGVIVAVVGLLVVFGIVVAALGALADATRASDIVAISGGAFTAVASIIGAYFGVRSANAAREDAARARDKESDLRERDSLVLAEVSNAAPENAVRDAVERSRNR